MNKSLVISALAILALGAGGWYYWSSHKAEEAAAEDMAQAGQHSAAVSVLALKSETIRFQHNVPGRISPFKQSQVRPQVDGIVTERLFEEGAEVEKGQQLYQIDDARYAAALNSALADLKSAQASVKTVEARAARYKELVKIKAVSQQEYDDVVAEMDQAKAAIAVAQAAVDVARVNLDYTRVYAPISGRISRSFVTEGALVTANQSQYLATITQLDPVYVDMQQSGGADAMRLSNSIARRQDQIPVTLILDEKSGATYAEHGSLKFSEVTVDETTGAIALRALFPNPDGVLLPGMFVRASIDLGQREVLLVPQRAASRTPDGKLTVWVVDADGKAQVKPIEVESAYQDNWIVKDGLAPGERVIIEGYMKLRAPGTPVSPVPWNKTGGSEEPVPQPNKAAPQKQAQDNTQE